VTISRPELAKPVRAYRNPRAERPQRWRTNPSASKAVDMIAAQERTVSPNHGKSYAPAIFETLPGANGFNRRAFAKSQERLLAAGRLAVKTVGHHQNSARSSSDRGTTNNPRQANGPLLEGVGKPAHNGNEGQSDYHKNKHPNKKAQAGRNIGPFGFCNSRPPFHSEPSVIRPVR
jgi:hypothetical protein